MNPQDNKEFIRESKNIISKSFGGTGGKPFGVSGIRSIQLQTGEYVDALIINDVSHGGPGGVKGERIELQEFEYIRKMEIRHGKYVDFIYIETSRGQIIKGGGDGGEKSTIEGVIVGFGGRSGKFLDQVDVAMVLTKVSES